MAHTRKGTVHISTITTTFDLVMELLYVKGDFTMALYRSYDTAMR